MDTVKDSVIQMIHRMPDTASVQDIMAEQISGRRWMLACRRLIRTRG